MVHQRVMDQTGPVQSSPVQPPVHGPVGTEHLKELGSLQTMTSYNVLLSTLSFYFVQASLQTRIKKGAYIIPQRFNQSPLESYFGHVRQTSGGSQAVTEAMYSAKHRKIGTLSALKGKGSMNVSGTVSQLVTSNSAFTPTRHR